MQIQNGVQEVFMSVTLMYATQHFFIMEKQDLFQLPYTEQLLLCAKIGFLQQDPGDSKCCDSLIDLSLWSDQHDAGDNLSWLSLRSTCILLCKFSYMPPSTAAGSTFDPR